MAYSMTSVPLYDTLGPDAVTYISGHAELSVIACSIDVLDTLIKCLPECPTVKLVVRTSDSLLSSPYAVQCSKCCPACITKYADSTVSLFFVHLSI